MSPLVVDRYELLEELASGGMAKVFLGRLRGESGFTRTVAVKRLHPHLASDPQFVAMFVDEARLASRISHPNVVATLDVVKHGEELLLVMDYVHGESLGKIVRALEAEGKTVPLPIVGAIVSGMLQGLHAAHEARDEKGAPLGLVHRDVSPQNVIVGADGVARVVDFGIAKAAGRTQSSTVNGQIKGKAAYMAPEQLAGVVDRRTDVFAASVIFWELLTGRRLFLGENEAETITRILTKPILSPKEFAQDLSDAIEEVVMAGLDRVPARRFATAREMDQALRRAMPVASAFDVGEWVVATTGSALASRALLVAKAEGTGVTTRALASGPPDDDRSRQAPEAVSGNEPTRLDDSPTTSSRSRSHVRALAAAFGVVLLLVTAGALAWSRAKDREPITPAAASSDLAAAPPTAVAPTSVAVDSVASAVAPEPTPEKSASAAVSPRPTHAPTKHKKVSTSNCDPPFFIDALGKHFKEECL